MLRLRGCPIVVRQRGLRFGSAILPAGWFPGGARFRELLALVRYIHGWR